MISEPRTVTVDGKTNGTRPEFAGVSIIIPAYNEAEVIDQTLQHVGEMARSLNLDAEVLVVDDGSGDGTGEKAREGGAQTLRHPHNVGYGRSLKDGIKSARHDTIVITDADGTYPIDQIPALLQHYSEGFDMVVGARTGRVYDGSVRKLVLRWILKFLVEFTTGRRVPDVNSGLRVFSRDTAMTYFSHLCDGFSFTTSMTLAYMMTGRFVTYVSVPYHERVGKTKVNLFRDALRTMQFIVEAIVYYNPIKIFILISFFCGLIGVVCLGLGLWLGLTAISFIGAALLLGMILVFCLGLIAVLLKQIMDRSPSAIVRER